MHIEADQLLSSFLLYGSLSRAIDGTATNETLPTTGLPTSWTVYLSPRVLSELLNRGFSKQLHAGVLALACRLDKPHSPAQYEMLDKLIDAGLSVRYLDEAMRRCGAEGLRKSLRSRPQIGYAHRARNNM